MNTSKIIYLDHAAATPLDPEVLSAMEPYFSNHFYNPSALYSGGREAHRALEQARETVAQTIGCRPSEIIFTAGGSESTNLAIRGIGELHPDGEIVISSVEHEAVRQPAQLYACVESPVNENGLLNVEILKESITELTVMVSVMYANNEVGTIQPIREVAEYVQKVREARRMSGNERPLYLHVDACQAPLYLDCNVARLKVDMMTLNGGKMYGPKQSGVLFVKSGIRLAPQILGGGQEFGIRNGTENVAFAVGFASAIKKAQTTHKANAHQVSLLSHQFMQRLETELGAVVNGHKKKRLPNNIHVTFPGRDNERMLFSLDEQGVFAAAGSACSASNEEVSHVLSAMGMSEEDARASLRFTIGLHTTEDELKTAISCIQEALRA